MALTDTRIRNAKPKPRRYRIADSHGLAIEVMPSGARYWRYRYRMGGKENLFAGGEWCAAPVGESPQQAQERQEAGRMTFWQRPG